MEEKLVEAVVAINLLRLLGRISLLIPVCGSFLSTSIAQEAAYRMAPNKVETEIDFLANYYSQDGDFGAPQGGIGTEQLENIAGIVLVTVGIDSNSQLSVTGGVDYYSSASTDRIDRQLSTASANDLRAYGNVSWTERRLETGRSYSFTVGTSQEYDYSSFSGGLGFSQEWGRGMHELSAGLQVYIDQWDLIYPIEFRRRGGFNERGPLPSAARQSYGFSLAYSRIINRRVQMGLTAEAVAMQGLLSTPFHRIYYQGATSTDLDADDIERLPDNRYKFPVSLRVNWKLNDALALRSFARYYIDTWNLQAASAELELAYDVSEAWTLMPFGRIYDQRAARYYAGFAEHLPSEEFYTSDFDLAAFSTYKLGLGFRYAPVFGLRRGNIARYGLDWRDLSFRAAYFKRNLGLEAYTFTFGTRFVITRRPLLTAK